MTYRRGETVGYFCAALADSGQLRRPFKCMTASCVVLLPANHSCCTKPRCCGAIPPGRFALSYPSFHPSLSWPFLRDRACVQLQQITLPFVHLGWCFEVWL